MSQELDERLVSTPQSRAGLRLAVLSTPRSGNTWLRHLLAASFGLEQQAVHNPGEIDWLRLPAHTSCRCIGIPLPNCSIGSMNMAFT